MLSQESKRVGGWGHFLGDGISGAVASELGLGGGRGEERPCEGGSAQ